jgi:hypothetical protein
MSETETWYIVKQANGHCAIVTAAELAPLADTLSASADDRTQWGPFASEGEAVARRVGLIRAGKCQPS